MKKMIVALLVSTVFASAAHAAPVVYSDAASFTSATNSVATETFASVANQSNVIVTPGFTVAAKGASVGSGSYSSSRSLTYSTNATPLVFTFSSTVSAFAFDLYDLGTLGSTTLSATYNGITVNLLSNYTGTTGNHRFVGFSDDATSFSTLVLSNSRQSDFFEIDNVHTGLANVTGAVPEPASWAMMILGVGLVGFALRSAKRHSDARFDYKIKRITAGLEA